MFTLKHVVVFFILQNTVSPERFTEENSDDQYYSDWPSPPTSDESIHSECDGYDYNKHAFNYTCWLLKYFFYNNSITETRQDSSTENSDNSSSKTPEISTTESSEDSSIETPDNTITENQKNYVTDLCPEDYSYVSHNDINYLIDENAEMLKIIQQFENSSYPDSEKLIQHFMGELEIFLKKFIDRPDHMKDILNDMADLRKNLYPDVMKIATELELINTFEDNLNSVVASSDNKIMQLERFKHLCQLNCEDISNRFGQDNNNNVVVLQSAGMYCIKLGDLNNIISEKLREVHAQHNDSFYVVIEVSEKMYAQKMAEFKTNLKKSAVKLFGMTMYDILSLQDDYHHFSKYLKQVNISSETFIIRKNTAEIDLRLIGLEGDLQKYRQYCMNCFISQRMKYDVIDLPDGSALNGIEERSNILVDHIAEIETAVDELINVKIDAIRGVIKSNFTAMFEKLDRQLNNSEVVDEYLMKLRPIQEEIEEDVKAEQDALLDLKSRIPEASVDKILELSKKSKETIQTLESAKQFIDQFIS